MAGGILVSRFSLDVQERSRPGQPWRAHCMSVALSVAINAGWRIACPFPHFGMHLERMGADCRHRARRSRAIPSMSQIPQRQTELLSLAQR
jgi:hypothetical protein